MKNISKNFMAIQTIMFSLWSFQTCKNTILKNVHSLGWLLWLWFYPKHIMSWCGMDFQSTPLHITYSFQHFELIQYVDGLSKFLLTYQINDPKVTINLNDFPYLSKLVVQQPPIQLWQLAMHFYWNWKFDSALMDILKDNWDSPLEYVVSLFNIFCNKNIT